MSARKPCPVGFCRAEVGHRDLHDIRACTRNCGPILHGLPRAWHAADCPNGAWLREQSQTSVSVDVVPAERAATPSAHSDGWQRPPHNGSSDSDGAAQS